MGPLARSIRRHFMLCVAACSSLVALGLPGMPGALGSRRAVAPREGPVSEAAPLVPSLCLETSPSTLGNLQFSRLSPSRLGPRK